jgi:DNA repair protein RecO (recombination protein O)
MYHIHHTNALILSSRPSGEANRVFTLLTRELGLISAVAQGVRLGKSKLRYALSDYAYAHIDLVHGKEMWRVTSATPVTTFPGMRATTRGVKTLTQVSKVIRRLVRGEMEFQEELFDDILRAYEHLEAMPPDAKRYNAIESQNLAISRMMRSIKNSYLRMWTCWLLTRTRPWTS